MDLVISSEEFRRLSSATQKELLSILMGADIEGDAVFAFEDYDSPNADSLQGSSATASKLVYPINAQQASDLLSNLAEKSQQTLRLFAEGERVLIDDLVGDGRPYKDLNDLKRSFVGAVNRRLRTVVGNRSAVLFSSDRDRQKIRVLPMSASALRLVMGVPEPAGLNAFDDVDFDGGLDEEQEQ